VLLKKIEEKKNWEQNLIIIVLLNNIYIYIYIYIYAFKKEPRSLGLMD